MQLSTYLGGSLLISSGDRYNLFLVMMLSVLALIIVCFDSIVRILRIYSCRLS
jgi:hypothetical protein